MLELRKLDCTDDLEAMSDIFEGKTLPYMIGTVANYIALVSSDVPDGEEIEDLLDCLINTVRFARDQEKALCAGGSNGTLS